MFSISLDRVSIRVTPFGDIQKMNGEYIHFLNVGSVLQWIRSRMCLQMGCDGGWRDCFRASLKRFICQDCKILPGFYGLDKSIGGDTA